MAESSKPNLICLNCGAIDSGNYCSSCRTELRVPPRQIGQVIAARLVREGATPAADPSQSPLPQRAWPTLIEVASTLPYASVLVDASPGTYKNLITISGVISKMQLDRNLIDKIDGIFANLVEWRGTVEQVGAVILDIFVFCEDGCSKEDRQWLRQLARRRWKIGFSASLRYVCLDLTQRNSDQRWWSFDLACSQANAAINQVVPADCEGDQPDSWTRGLRKAGAVVFEPFVDFYEGLRLLGRPRMFARRVRAGAFGFTDLIRYAIASAVLTSLAEKLTGPRGESFELVKLPMLGEASNAAIFLAISLLGAIFYHICMKVVGGKGSIKDSFYATAIVSLSGLPFYTLLEGLLGPNANGAAGSSAIYLAAVMGPLHGISAKRAYWVMLAGAMIVFVLAIVVAILAFGLLR